MLEKGKITQGQFMILTIFFVIGSSIIIIPSLTVTVAGQDAWLAVLISMSVSGIHIFFYGILIKRYPAKNLIEINESVVGKWIGRAISFLFFCFFLMLTSGLLRLLGDFLVTYILPETPLEAVNVTYLLLVIYGVRLGLEPITRTAQILFPWFLLFLFLVIVLLIPEIDFTNLSPFYENGIRPILKASYITIGIPFTDIVILLMITPYVAPTTKSGKSLYLGVASGGMILFIIILLTILVLGSVMIGQLTYPIYVLTQKISIANFIQRIEVIAGGIIFISMFIKVTVSFYSTTLSLAQLLHLKLYKILTLPLGMLVIAVQKILFPNIILFNKFVTSAWTPVVLIFSFVIPIILIFVDTIKREMKKG